MSELKILRNYNGLEIWKGDDEKFPFCRNDMAELINCIEKVLNKDVDEYEFKREEYGSFRLARDGDGFRLYGNLDKYYPCTERELKRLLNNVCEIFSPATRKRGNLTIKDLSKVDILIIANHDDEKAAIRIKNKIHIKFRLSAIICDNVKWEKWNKSKPELLIDKPQVSLGGPEYNDTTKYIEDNFANKPLSSFPDYKIKIGEKDIAIYGEGTAKLTMKATRDFLNSRMLDYYIYCCRQFLESKKEQPITTQNPKNKKPAASKKKIKTIKDFSTIRINRDKHNRIITEIHLVYKSDSSKHITIDFKKASDRQFSLLIFLILERLKKESDWLLAGFNELKTSEHFLKVCKYCKLSEDKLKENGWWNDPLNERKKGYVLEINRKLRNLGVEGDLIVLHSKHDGVYNLCKGIRPAKVKDLL